MSCTRALTVQRWRGSLVCVRMIPGATLLTLLHGCLGFMVEETYALNFLKRGAVPSQIYKVGRFFRHDHVLETSTDTDIRCIKDDIVRRVHEVVIPTGAGYYRVSNTVLLENIKVNDSGQYVCIALTNGTKRSRVPRWNITIVSVLQECPEGWRCNSAVLPTECSSACRCPNMMYSVGKAWRCGTPKGVLQLDIRDQYGESYQHGDRVIVSRNDNLVLRYELLVDTDAVVTEQLRGVESTSTVSLPVTATQYRERRTIVLWNVTSSNTVLVRLSLQSHPVMSKEIILSVLSIPRQSVGMECMDDAECRALSALCLDKECSCSFANNVSGTCFKACKKKSDCKGFAGTVCDNSLCRCPHDMFLFNGRCYTQECSNRYECSRTMPNSICYKGSCVCKHGFNEINRICRPIVCSKDEQCQDTSMRCKNSSCTCAQDSVDHMGKCIKSMQVKRKKTVCYFDPDCGSDETCLAHACVCRKGTETTSGFCKEAASDITTARPEMKQVFVLAAGVGMSITIVASFIVCLALFTKQEEAEDAMVANSADVVHVSDGQWARNEESQVAGTCAPSSHAYDMTELVFASA